MLKLFDFAQGDSHPENNPHLNGRVSKDKITN